MSGNAPTVEQEQALIELVAAGRLDLAQARAVRSALWGEPLAEPGTGAEVAARTGAGRRGRDAAGPGALAIEVAAYLGGGLLLGGAGLLIGLSWRQVGRAQTFAMLAATAVALVLASLVVARGPAGLRALRPAPTSVRRRLAGVLLVLSSVPAAMATGIATDEYAVLRGCGVGLVVAAAAYWVLPTAPGLLATAAMSALATSVMVSLVTAELPLVREAAIIGLGLGWTALALSRLAPPRRLGLATGAALVIAGAQLGLGAEQAGWAYGLTMLSALGCFALYWFEGATVLLVAGVIAATLAVPEAVSHWTHGALSGPAILLIAGAALIGTSSAGARLHFLRHPPAGSAPSHVPAELSASVRREDATVS